MAEMCRAKSGGTQEGCLQQKAPVQRSGDDAGAEFSGAVW